MLVEPFCFISVEYQGKRGHFDPNQHLLKNENKTRKIHLAVLVCTSTCTGPLNHRPTKYYIRYYTQQLPRQDAKESAQAPACVYC